MTGTLSPDATGEYEYDGMYAGEGSYKLTTGNRWLWWDAGITDWVNTDEVGNKDRPFWARDATIVGDYDPFGGATGVATVARI